MLVLHLRQTHQVIGLDEHESQLGVRESMGQAAPGVLGDFAVLPSVHGPDAPILQHLYQLVHLFVLHAVFEVADVQHLDELVLADRLDDLGHLLGSGVQMQPRIVLQAAVPPVRPEVLTAQLLILQSLERLPHLQVVSGSTTSNTLAHELQVLQGKGGPGGSAGACSSPSGSTTSHTASQSTAACLRAAGGGSGSCIGIICTTTASRIWLSSSSCGCFCRCYLGYKGTADDP
mmetsp:Transcript_18404/g.55440  ORF Transcript_18404/g.55440 Transcript_18404/m.55440 type:complete len:232 (+) Transcript_18404:11275-11970(+)